MTVSEVAMIRKVYLLINRNYQSKDRSCFTFPGLALIIFISFFLIFVNTYYSLDEYTRIQGPPVVESRSDVINTSLNCLCNGENFCFKGLDEDGKVSYGRPFNCEFYDKLKSLQLLDSDANSTKNDFDELDETWRPVIMTVVSSNHFTESKGMVESVFKYHSDAILIYYDVGLTDKEVKEVKSWKGVEYRKFNFRNYPPHVKNLLTYAFKLAQFEVFEQYKTFYYFDSSVRVKKKLNHLSGVKNHELLPFIMPSQSLHSVYAAVNSEMLKYLPMPNTVLYAQENAATFMFFSDSKLTRRIFKWWLLCGMTEGCIAPIGSKMYCGDLKVIADTYKTKLGCHRFDQAYFNIALLSYLFGEPRIAAQYNFVSNWVAYSDNLINDWNKSYRKRFKKYESSIGYKCLEHKVRYDLN